MIPAPHNEGFRFRIPKMLGEDEVLVRVESAAWRMKEWASAHGECDTQGIMDDEWIALARAALNLPERAA